MVNGLFIFFFVYFYIVVGVGVSVRHNWCVSGFVSVPLLLKLKYVCGFLLFLLPFCFLFAKHNSYLMFYMVRSTS